MFKMKSPIIFVALVSLLLGGCKTQKKAQELPPEITYEKGFTFDFIQSNSLFDVVDHAEKENKLVFVDVYTDWCLPCKIMEEEVFTNEDLGDYFNDNFVSYKIDAEKGKGADILAIYDIKAYPTLLFLDHKGRVLEKKDGLAYARELRSLAANAIEIDQNNSATD